MLKQRGDLMTVNTETLLRLARSPDSAQMRRQEDVTSPLFPQHHNENPFQDNYV